MLEMAGSQPLEIGGRTIKVTNLDKVLYPTTGTTKHDVLSYYATVAPHLIAHAKHRPATRKRWPDGVLAKPFFEKNLPSHAPDWLPRVTLPHSKRDVTYPLIDDVATLLWLVQGAALELHTPQWQWDSATDQPARPDRLVVDLDPGPGAGLELCARVAVVARAELANDGLTDVCPVTSGSKGIQLYASLRELGPEDPNAYARTLAQRLNEALPDITVFAMTRADRTDRVFIDWSQNNRGKTTIAPYSLRGRDEPWVAAPRTWDEIEDAPNLRQLHYSDVVDRLASQGDLFTL